MVNRLRLATLLLTLSCAGLSSLVQADTGEIDSSRLEGAATLAEVIATLGRPSDSSEAGGACGGIVVHDWIAENLRVVTLGERVDTVSPIR